MKIKLLYAALALVAFGSIASSRTQTPQKEDSASDLHTVTLYSVANAEKGRGDDSKACLSFNLGTYAKCISMDADLGYGFTKEDVDDVFMLMHYQEARTVMKDLGELDWTQAFKVPKLDPLPELKPGKKRKIVIGASNEDGEPGIFETKLSAIVLVGHIYEVHVKKMDQDFYVLFRVDDGEANRLCKISWKRIPAPGKKLK